MDGPAGEILHLGDQRVYRRVAFEFRVAPPRSRKISTIDQFPRGVAKLASRPSAVRTARKHCRLTAPVLFARPRSQHTSNGLARVCQLSFEPPIECHIEQR